MECAGITHVICCSDTVTTFSVMSKFMRRASFCGPVDLLWKSKAVVFITTVIVKDERNLPLQEFFRAN